MFGSRARFRARSRALWVVLTVAFVGGGGSALAQESSRDFEPPQPDKFDWIQIVSDEWLKGEIIAMYDDSLEFDSDELDELTFDFEDVKKIRSTGTMQVGLVDGGVAIGQLFLDGDEVRVVGDQEQKVERSQILSITSGAPREKNYWSGKVSAGANFRQGNTDQVETNGHMGFMRRTVKNRMSLDYLANFSRTDDTTLSDNQRATVGWDRFVSDRFFLSPVLGEYFRDPFQNIAHRYTIGAGAGYQIIDTSKIDWQASVGLAYQNTRFDDVLEGDPTSASTPTLVASTLYDHELSGSVDLTLQYRFFVVNEESGQYTHHFVTGFEFDLIGSLDFDVTFVWDRIEKPRQNSDGTFPKKDDYRLNLALGFDF
jgi:putative salt-induced outer membrane protein YdiY